MGTNLNKTTGAQAKGRHGGTKCTGEKKKESQPREGWIKMQGPKALKHGNKVHGEVARRPLCPYLGRTV